MDLSPQNEGMRLPTKDDGEVSYLKEKWPGYHADENEDEDEDEDDDDDDDDEDEEEGWCWRKQWGALAER